MAKDNCPIRLDGTYSSGTVQDLHLIPILITSSAGEDYEPMRCKGRKNIQNGKEMVKTYYSAGSLCICGAHAIASDIGLLLAR